jgi:flagellar hook protein FlgE
MGIFGALTTAVTGLRAQSFALENVSGNIANSQTTAFKRTDTSFEDLVADGAVGHQAAGSVVANSRATNTVQGDLQTASVGTFMAVNGSGFFVVGKPSSFVDNRPVFDSVADYTRRGDFQPDKNGFLVNGAGYYLMGIPVDPTTGNETGSVPQLLQFQNDFLPAEPTTAIDYRANLASYPLTQHHDVNVPGSELLNPIDFVQNPLAGAAAQAKITGSTAALLPDAKSIGAGTVAGLSNATTLASLGITNGQAITVSDGTNSTTYTVVNATTENVGNVIAGLGGGAAAVGATLAGGKLQITSNNFLDTVTVSGAAAASLGFGSGNTTFAPTNLLNQGITAGQTLTVTVGGGAAQVITFGSGAGQVSTLGGAGGLLSQLQGLTGISAAAVDGHGNISLTAASTSDNIVIGSSNATEVSANLFGLTVLTARPANQTVIADDVTAFTNETIGGGAVTAYDTSGVPVNIQLRWGKVDSSTLGTGHSDVWNLFYQTNSNASGTQPAWKNAGLNYTFDPNGQMNPPIANLTLSGVTVNGVSLGDVQIVHGAGGLTQFADPNGNAQVNLLQQNGFAAGNLQQVSVSDKGRLVGSYSNGRTIDLAEISLVNFNGANFLKRIDGGAFQATSESGPAIFGGGGGKIVASSLEGSNTDIADEFTKLIVTQQAYSANTRVISTSNQMVQDVLNMIR